MSGDREVVDAETADWLADFAFPDAARTYVEQIEQASRIANAVSIPLIADAEFALIGEVRGGYHIHRHGGIRGRARLAAHARHD